MKINPVSSLILLSYLVSAVTFVGCESRADKAADAALAQTQKTADLNKTIAAQAEAQKAGVARQDYGRRMNYFNAIAGTFSGTDMTDSKGSIVGNAPGETSGPSALESTFPAPFKGNIQITFTTNLPDTTNKQRAPTEADVIAQTEAINFSVTVTETDEQGQFLASCQLDGVKPEYVDGVVRFACTGGARTYVFYLDKLDKDDGSSIISRSQGVSHALLQQSLSTVSFMKVEIITSFGVNLKGSLKRVQ